MTYNELRSFCEKHQISTTSVAADINCTLDGLHKGLDRQSLSMRFIPKLCRSLCITPNQLFGWDGEIPTPGTPPPARNQQNNYGNGNRQTILDNGLVDDLREQLKVKDDQIKSLLDILKK